MWPSAHWESAAQEALRGRTLHLFLVVATPALGVAGQHLSSARPERALAQSRKAVESVARRQYRVFANRSETLAPSLAEQSAPRGHSVQSPSAF